MTTMNYLSPTALNTFINFCGYRYYLEYVIKVLPKITTPEGLLGTILHRVFAESKPRDSFSMLLMLLKKNWFLQQFVNTQDEEKYKEIAIQLLKTFYNSPFHKTPAYSREKEYMFLYNNYYIKCKIDRLDYVADIDKYTLYRIVDFKTGTPPPKYEHLLYDMQTGCYLLAVSSAYNIPVGNLKFCYFYLKTNQIFEIQYNSKILTKFRRLLNKILSWITNQNFFKKITHRCLFCAANYICLTDTEKQKLQQTLQKFGINTEIQPQLMLPYNE